MAFLEGYGIGLAMVIFIGPVFFLLFHNSLAYGTKVGVTIALGILFSDILCVLLCYYGLSSFVLASKNQFWIGVLGSLILFGLGVSYAFKKNVEFDKKEIEVTQNSMRLSAFFVKGFSVNFFNPFVFVVWIGVFQYGSISYRETLPLILFLMAVLLGILTTDVLKVFVAKRIKNHLSSQRLGYGYKVTGIVLIVFAIRILYAVTQNEF